MKRLCPSSEKDPPPCHQMRAPPGAVAEAQETFQDHPEPVNFLVVCFEDPRIAL